MLKFKILVISILFVILPLHGNNIPQTPNITPIISYLLSDSTIDSDEEVDMLYVLEEDANNKIYIEKYINEGIVITQYENGVYTSTKILLDGDTNENILNIDYQEDKIILSYAGVSEELLAPPPVVETIDSQYVGIWLEDDEGTIDIVYIYEDKAIVFSAHTDTFNCSYSDELSVSEFKSLIKGPIDVADYVVAGAYESTIENSCGTYASYATPAYQQSLAKFESDLESTGSIMGDASETHVVVNAGEKIFDWFKSKVQSKIDKVTEMWGKIKNVANKFKKYATAKPSVSNEQAYDDVTTKINSNDISGIRDDIVHFEDYSNTEIDNSLQEAELQYEEVNEADELEVTKVISYEESKKVEEILVYDKDGNIIAIKIRTNFTADGGYDEEIMPANEAQVNTIVGVEGASAIGYYTRVTQISSYYILYVHNVAIDPLGADQDILNSLNKVDFTISNTLINEDGTWKYFESENVTGTWPEFHASWGVDNDTYATCYSTTASSFVVSYRKTGENEYGQNENLFVADYTLSSTPVTNPNAFCQTKTLKSFTQRGHIELELGTYWPN